MPQNNRRKTSGGNQNGNGGGQPAGRGGRAGRGTGRARGRARGRGSVPSPCIDLTPQNAATTGPGPYGLAQSTMQPVSMHSLQAGAQLGGFGGFGYQSLGMMGFDQMGYMQGMQMPAQLSQMNNAESTAITVKLGLGEAHRAAELQKVSALGEWQKRVCMQQGLPVEQHPQWDRLCSMYRPLDTMPQMSQMGAQQQQFAQQSQPQLVQQSQHVAMQPQGYLQGQPVGQQPSSQLTVEELEDDTEAWEVDNHDELIAQQQRTELIEQYIQCHIGSYVVSEEYVGDPAAAYTACAEAANRHAPQTLHTNRCGTACIVQ